MPKEYDNGNSPVKPFDKNKARNIPEKKCFLVYFFRLLMKKRSAATKIFIVFSNMLF